MSLTQAFQVVIFKHMMTVHSFVKSIILLGTTTLFFLSQLAAESFVKPGELKVGDRLEGVTRMGKNKMHRFEMEVLSVRLKGAPQTYSIWAEVKDDLLTETGVLAGMSGSPVYYQGRLVGAVAFTDTFLKKPILGITPIHEMLQIKDHVGKEFNPPFEQLKSVESMKSSIPSKNRGIVKPFNSPNTRQLNSASLAAYLEWYRKNSARYNSGSQDHRDSKLLNRPNRLNRPKISMGSRPTIHDYYYELIKQYGLSEVTRSDFASGQIGHQEKYSRINMPIQVNGRVELNWLQNGLLDRSSFMMAGSRLFPRGIDGGKRFYKGQQSIAAVKNSDENSDDPFVGKRASNQSKAEISRLNSDIKVVPGDLIGVNIVKGDVDISGYGTVTYVSNDYIWAFGHPMSGNSGAGMSALPIYSANTDAVVPSQLLSYKIGSLGKEIGTLVQDRYSAILVDRSRQASYLPIQVKLKSPINNQIFNFEVVRDQQYLHSLMSFTIFNSIMVFENRASTLEYQFDIELEDGQHIKTGNLISTFNNFQIGVLNMVQSLMGIAQLVDNNEFRSVGLKSVSLQVIVHPLYRIRVLRDIKLFKQQYYPGEAVKVELGVIDLQGYYQNDSGDLRHKRFGKPERFTVNYQLPDKIEPGIQKIMIGNEGQRLVEELVLGAMDKYRPRDINHLVELLNLKGRYQVLNLWHQEPEEHYFIKDHSYRKLPYNQSRLLKESLISDKKPFNEISHQEYDIDYYLLGTGELEIEILDPETR